MYERDLGGLSVRMAVRMRRVLEVRVLRELRFLFLKDDPLEEVDELSGERARRGTPTTVAETSSALVLEEYILGIYPRNIIP